MEMSSVTCSSENNEESGRSHANNLPIKTSPIKQLLAATLVNITMVSTGVQYAWPSVVLPRLESNDSGLIHITSSQGAWAVSALSVGGCLGPIMSSIVVDRVGRKWTLLSTFLPNFVCWLLIYFATIPEMLYIARFISGIGIGVAYSTVPMYLGEIADKRIRGALGIIMCIMISLGTLGTYIAAPFVSIPILSLIVMVPSIVFLFTFVWMPETPYYYLIKDQQNLAEKSLIWLRGTKQVNVELQEMWRLTKIEKQMRGSFMDLIKDSGNQRATFIAILAISAQQFSGILALYSYSGLIFEKTAYAIDPNFAVGTTGLVTLVFNIIAFFLVERAGRKPLLLISCIGCAVCLICLAIYFHAENECVDVSSIFWLPLASVMVFFAFHAIGLGPVPYAIISELYSTNVKAFAVMAISVYGSLLSVIVGKVYQVVADAWGEHVIFYTYAVIELFIGILIFFFVFETKGKSFDEIQARLNRIGNNSKVEPLKFQSFDNEMNENS